MPVSAEQSDERLPTDTLVLALTQCRDQIRLYAEQSQIIDHLKQENQRLKQELEKLQGKQEIDVEARYAAQFQQAFQQVAAKQIEIDRLKEKLRNAKIKAQRHGQKDLVSSSPAVAANRFQTASPHTPTFVMPPLPLTNKRNSAGNGSIARGIRSTQSASPPRKRARSFGTRGQLLQEVAVDFEPEIPKSRRTEYTKPSRQPMISASVVAIPELAEDGEDHLRRKRKPEGEQKSKNMPESVYHRLDNLLDSHAPSGPMLLRTQSSSPPFMRQPLLDVNQVKPAHASFGLPSPHTEHRAKRPRSSLETSRRDMTPDLEDNEPFRSRPINRLGLQHFKINPASNSGLDYAFNQVVRGHDRKCLPGCTRECCVGAFKALADTLPGLSTSDGRRMSDHELLLDYLGPNSEERIRHLTPKARDNLIHEARTKLVANTYGKMHRDVHDRGRSPPGFWRVDMPGSQEHNKDREDAKLSEREQVLQRYNDAIKGGGRWMFADE